LEKDIETELKNKTFYSREEVIACVRDFGNYRGFGICIPRGDITLQDKTLQITLYCHQYGNKRNRHQKGGNGNESWSSIDCQENMQIADEGSGG
jgi:hypothetical protein